MKFRFSIGRKISLGFSIIILSTVAVFFLTDSTLKDSIEINTRINDVTNPSVGSLEQLKLLTVRSKMLIQNWVNYQRSPEEDPDKIQLIELSDTDFPELKEEINDLANNWDTNDRDLIEEIFIDFEKLFGLHMVVRESLNTWDAYDDPINIFQTKDLVDPGGEIYSHSDTILVKLERLIISQESTSMDVRANMVKSFDQLQFIVRYLGFCFGVCGHPHFGTHHPLHC